MTEAQYVSAAGFVAFDPEERDVNGKQILEFSIRTLTSNGEQKLIRITVWPELKLASPVNKGDFVAVSGKFTSATYQAKDGSAKTALQISAYDIAVVTGATKSESAPTVVKKAAATPEVPF